MCVTEKEDEKPRFTINVNVDKILKLVELEGIKRHEEFLFAIKSRQAILIRAISVYLKRSVQITEFDPLLFEENAIMPNFEAALK
jgi:hypothetical protein